jgi:hypothetical protein
MLPQPSHHAHPFYLTHSSLGIGDTAAACRAAGLAFVNRVAHDVDPRAFLAWAARDYRRVTSFDEELGRPHAIAGVMPDARGLTGVVQAAHAHVLVELEAAALSRGFARFVADCVHRGLVSPSYNDRTERGWTAVDLPEGRLGDRVLSLFAVDYLANPGAYARELTVCPLCEDVVFDAGARERGFCSRHGAAHAH